MMEMIRYNITINQIISLFPNSEMLLYNNILLLKTAK